MKKYVPQPINTSHIQLPGELTELTEAMAKNVHEIWAAGRIAEGWQHGIERNDEKKEHPGLVAYEKLTEAEKQYDRKTALETIKLLIALGYRITK